MAFGFQRWRKRKPRAETNRRNIVVYTRQGCHLCDRALTLLAKHGVPVETVDIDGRPELVGRYGDKAPVIAVDGEARLWGDVKEPLLRRLLRTLANSRPGS